MSGGTLAALATGIFGLISGVAAAVLSYRAQRNTAKADEVAATFDAYDKLVHNLQAELDRVQATTARDRQNLQNGLNDCEARCRECRQEIGELVANLAALRSIVLDEVARSAADVVLDEHGNGLTDNERAELDAIKQFLDRLPPDARP